MEKLNLSTSKFKANTQLFAMRLYQNDTLLEKESFVKLSKLNDDDGLYLVFRRSEDYVLPDFNRVKIATLDHEANIVNELDFTTEKLSFDKLHGLDDGRAEYRLGIKKR